MEGLRRGGWKACGDGKDGTDEEDRRKRRITPKKYIRKGKGRTMMEKRVIPFSPPDISELEINEVAEAMRSGVKMAWLSGLVG